MNRKEQLQALLATLGGDMEAITAAVAAENRAMTDEEQARFDKLSADFDKTNREIANIDRVEATKAALAQPMPRVTQPMPTTGTTTTAPPGTTPVYSPIMGQPAAHSFANHGFTKGPGEFLMAVYKAGTSHKVDDRLMVNAVTTFGGEGVGADGAFALPPQFVTSVTNAVMPEDSFLSAMRPIQTNSNTLVVPKNEKAPWSATGITSAKTAEGAAITASKPSLGELRIALYKAASLVHVSEESLSDIPFLSSFVMDQMGQHLRYQLENWVLNGTGEGEPLGILNAASTVAISDADSTATAIGAVDILSMEAALLPGSGAFFLVNPTILPAIGAMKTGSAGYPLMNPDMSLPAKQALLGRPMYRSEACPILNTTGDIILVQPSGMVFALKSGGVQTATTIGFAFDQDLQSFRATLRAGFAPLLSAKVERAKSSGSTFASHAVVITGSRS